jgi:hypothetical protein
LEELSNLLYILGKNDGLRDQTIEAGIRGEGYQVDGTDEDALGGDLRARADLMLVEVTGADARIVVMVK